MQNLYLRLGPYLLTCIEALLLLGAAALIFFCRTKSTNLAKLERILANTARRKRLAVLLTGLSVIAIRAALIPILGVPQPRFNDEFSYLLAGDTFAHGRLSNPTHPMWIHFENLHIIQKPTYMSMYPPAEGIVLALGERLGNPWIGQALVTALMCASIGWMLQAWVPPGWALLGAALAVLRLGLMSYWMNTYFAASVVALGGALVLGAWPRLRQRLRIRHALLMGLGLVILANSRPYEGLIFSLPVAACMLGWMSHRGNQSLQSILVRAALPLALVLACGALVTGYYYWRVTGDPFRMAYQVNRSTYATAPYFWWGTPSSEPVYHNAVMPEFYRRELWEFEQTHTLAGFLTRQSEKLEAWWQFYLGPLLTLPLLALPWVVRRRKMRLPLVICAAMAVGLSVQTWNLPHYFSPATGALYLVIVQCLRQLRHCRQVNPEIGSAWVRAIPIVATAMILFRLGAAASRVPVEPAWPRGNLDRAHILSELNQLAGRQLVLVSYGVHTDPTLDWVYNGADIDAAKVVWARSLTEAENLKLLAYFNDRRVWRVDPDVRPIQLQRYEAGR
jgi:hypothetical protein